MRADLGAAATAGALLLALGCAGDDASGLIVEVRSDLTIPTELDRLTVNVWSQDRLLSSRDYVLGPQPGEQTLPASLALVPSGSPSAALTVETLGQLGPVLMVARSLRLRFMPEVIQRVELDLGRECIGVLCPVGKTCVPGLHCVSPEIHATRPPALTGEACDCNSYYPLCLGASWTYEQVSFSTGLPNSKTSLIQDYDRLDNAHGKAQKLAFVQFRTKDGGVQRRWLTVEGEPGRRRIVYEKEEMFDSRWRPARTIYWVPNRLRFDEGRTTLGESWSREHEVFEYRRDDLSGDPWKTTDTWTVVPIPAAQQLWINKRWNDVVCHRRVGREFEDLPEFEQVYCFARGVGKVFEHTPGDDDERLADYTIPGCPRDGR